MTIPKRILDNEERDILLLRRLAASGVADTTSAGKQILQAPDASTQRTALGLGTAATQSTAAFAAASHDHSASAITSGTIATARLGSGSANSGTYLRGDQTWQAVSGSGGGGNLDDALAIQVLM